MPLKNKKIVISGGPGSGKTTLIDLLNKNGFDCIEELSRGIIQNAREEGEDNFFTSQPIIFSEQVWQGRRRQYETANSKSCNHQKPYVFFDRGLYDVVAYLECLAISYDPNRFDLTKYNYDLALLLPPWKAIYTTDNERKESFEEAEKLYFYIKKTYQNQRIPIIEIPFQSPEARISTLLQYLDHGKNA